MNGQEKKVIMPSELTAENGAKGLCSGEFYEINIVACPECDNGIIDDNETCEECEGAGEFSYKVYWSWDKIKDMYKVLVKHFGEDL